MRWSENNWMNTQPVAMVPAVILFCLLLFTPEYTRAADEDCRALQNQIEAGKDLSPRAQKTLFSSRTRQDEGQNAEAAELMGKWIGEHPKQHHHLMYFNLAVSQLGLDQYPQALENFEKAVALEPRFSRGWLRLGEAAYEQQHYARAAEAFYEGHNFMCDPSPEIRYYSAVAWLLAKEPGKSLAGMLSLLDDNTGPVTMDWYQALVAAASEAGEYGEARPWVDNCLMENESNPKAWYLAYQFAVAAEEYQQAAVWLTIVGHLRPLNRSELIQLGSLYAGSGVPLQAARYYRQALDYPEVEPGATDYLRLASAWMAAYKMEEARETLDRALVKFPTVKMLALLGDLNYAEKKFKEARRVFGQCVALDPNYGRGWLMSGYCSLELGQNSDARTALERAQMFKAQESNARELLRRIP